MSFSLSLFLNKLIRQIKYVAAVVEFPGDYIYTIFRDTVMIPFRGGSVLQAKPYMLIMQGNLIIQAQESFFLNSRV